MISAHARRYYQTVASQISCTTNASPCVAISVSYLDIIQSVFASLLLFYHGTTKVGCPLLMLNLTSNYRRKVVS